MHKKLWINTNEHTYRIKETNKDTVELELDDMSILILKHTYPIFNKDGTRKDLTVSYNNVSYHVTNLKQTVDTLNLILN